MWNRNGAVREMSPDRRRLSADQRLPIVLSFATILLRHFGPPPSKTEVRQAPASSRSSFQHLHYPADSCVCSRQHLANVTLWSCPELANRIGDKRACVIQIISQDSHPGSGYSWTTVSDAGVGTGAFHPIGRSCCQSPAPRFPCAVSSRHALSFPSCLNCHHCSCFAARFVVSVCELNAWRTLR